MNEKADNIKAVLITPVPERPAFDTFLASLEAAELLASVDNGVLTIEIANKNNIESVRGLVEALLGSDQTVITIRERMESHLGKSISELELNRRAEEALLNAGILTVRDLLYYSRGELSVITSSYAGIRKIIIALYKLDLYIGMFKHSMTCFARKDLESNEAPYGWLTITKLSKILPFNKKIKRGIMLRRVLEPLTKKIPNQIDWFNYGTRRIMYCHPELADEIVVNSTTIEDLGMFVKTALDE